MPKGSLSSFHAAKEGCVRILWDEALRNFRAARGLYENCMSFFSAVAQLYLYELHTCFLGKTLNDYALCEK